LKPSNSKNNILTDNKIDVLSNTSNQKTNTGLDIIKEENLSKNISKNIFINELLKENQANRQEDSLNMPYTPPFNYEDDRRNDIDNIEENYDLLKAAKNYFDTEHADVTENEV